MLLNIYGEYYNNKISIIIIYMEIENDYDLNVLPVITDNKGTKLKYPIHSHMPNLSKSFVLGMVAPRGSGKGVLITNLLLNPNFLNRENYDNAFIISPTIYNDRTAAHLRENFKGSLFDKYDDTIIRDIIQYQQSFNDEDKPKTILVCDDLVGFKTPQLDFLSTRSRHNNISMITSVQQCKAIKKVMRNNLTDVILFRTKNKKEFQDIYDEWGALYGSFDEFKKMYDFATKEKYNFLYLKLDENPVQALHNFTENITNKFNNVSEEY